MPKASAMISINPEELRAIVQSRGAQLSALGEAAGVSKQAVNGWLLNSRMPPKSLSIFVQQLDLSAEEVKRITTKLRPEARVQFRTNRNIQASAELDASVKFAGRDFFTIHSMGELAESAAPIYFRDSPPPHVVADHLKSVLGLDKKLNVSLDQLLIALRGIDVHVLFHNFGEEFADENAHAACVTFGGHRAIFVNAMQFIEDAAWRIFHEVAHLVMNHEGFSEAQEKFCNAVGTQAMTPDSYFQEHKARLKQLFSGNIRVAPFVVQELMNELGSSFKGIILALQTHKIVTPQTAGYLFAVDNRRRKDGSMPKIIDFISPKDGDDHFEFWKRAMNDPQRSKLLVFQQMIQRGLVLDRMSIGRAAELLGTDEKTAEELANYWKAEYGDQGNH